MSDRNPFETLGYTKNSVHDLKDARLTAKLKQTEEKFGIETGGRFMNDESGKPCEIVVSVTFYPKTKFHVQRLAPDRSLLDAAELTKEAFDQTWSLRL